MLHQLLANLNSRDAVLRQDAERRLRALPPDELLQFAQLEQAHFMRWAAGAWAKVFVCFFALEAPFVLLMIFLVHFLGLRRGIESQFLCIPMMMLFCVLFYWFRCRQYPHSRHALASVIKELNDVRFIPILLTMKEGAGGSVDTTKAVNEALLHLLLQLCAGQANVWTNEQRKVVLGWLASPVSNFDLSIAALRSLEQAGGEWAIPAVKKCAELKTQVTIWNKQPGISRETTREKIMQIKQAAQECLPYLEQHTKEAKQVQTLLRAAQVSTPPDTLLRPSASAPQEAEGEQLLRPTSD